MGLKQPANGIALDLQQAMHVARRIGFPVLVRPSYVLGGRAMEIVYDERALSGYVEQAMEVSPGKPILIDKFLESAIEVDVDCLSDGQRTLIGGVMQHIEEAGIHSGDSACVIPPHSLPAAVVEEIKRQTRALARELNVKGLMNVQFASDRRASRDRDGTPVAFTSWRSIRGPAGPCRSCPRRPACRWPATPPLVMVGKTLDELGLVRRGRPEAFLGQGERVSVQQVPGRGHHPGSGDAFDRRGHGHRRQLSRWRLPRASWRPTVRCRCPERSSSRWPTATSRRSCRLLARLAEMGYR